MRKPLNDKGSLKLSLAAKIITKGVNIIVILEIFSGLIKDVIKVTLIIFSLGKKKKPKDGNVVKRMALPSKLIDRRYLP